MLLSVVQTNFASARIVLCFLKQQYLKEPKIIKEITVTENANFKRMPPADKNSRDEFLSAPHSFSAAQVTAALGVEAAIGLSKEEADLRFARDGANTLEHSAERSWMSILLGQFSSIIVWLLAFAAITPTLLSGPMKIIPSRAQAAAKSGFSERKP